MKLFQLFSLKKGINHCLFVIIIKKVIASEVSGGNEHMQLKTTASRLNSDILFAGILEKASQTRL